jgi:hypothetical protein
MSDVNERVAIYVMDDAEFSVYACYDSWDDMDNRDVSFYDVYNDKTGECVNEGDPFYEFPTWKQVFDNYYQRA